MSRRTYAVSAPAEPASLRALRGFFGAVLEGLDQQDVERLVLALDEACSNLVKHRKPQVDDGSLCVVAEELERGWRFRIGGFCRVQDVHQIKPRDLEDVRPGGLGTSFIAQIMDRVAYEPDPEKDGAVSLVLEWRGHQGGGAAARRPDDGA